MYYKLLNSNAIQIVSVNLKKVPNRNALPNILKLFIQRQNKTMKYIIVNIIYIYILVYIYLL